MGNSISAVSVAMVACTVCALLSANTASRLYKRGGDGMDAWITVTAIMLMSVFGFASLLLMGAVLSLCL